MSTNGACQTLVRLYYSRVMPWPSQLAVRSGKAISDGEETPHRVLQSFEQFEPAFGRLKQSTSFISGFDVNDSDADNTNIIIVINR